MPALPAEQPPSRWVVRVPAALLQENSRPEAEAAGLRAVACFEHAPRTNKAPIKRFLKQAFMGHIDNSWITASTDLSSRRDLRRKSSGLLLTPLVAAVCQRRGSARNRASRSRL